MCLNNKQCNTTDGSCSACTPNFQMPLCKVCEDGYYGEKCTDRCGSCANNTGCDKTSGHCPAGCKPGYKAPDCRQACDKGRYGVDCGEECGHCATNGICQKETGSCYECQGNYSLPLCQECVSGYYGDACASACGPCATNTTCLKDSGHCPSGCKPGFGGLFCVEKASGGLSSEDGAEGNSTTVCVAIGLVVAAVLVVIGIVVIRRRIRGGKGSGRLESSDAQGNAAPSRAVEHYKETPLSYQPVANTQADGNASTKPKPSMVVRPIVNSRAGRKTKGFSNGTTQSSSDPIYGNNPASTSSSSSSSTAAAAKASRTAATVANFHVPDGGLETSNKPRKETSAELFDEDAASLAGEDIDVNGEDPVYGNVEKNLYAVFKASNPQLDSVQLYLLERLASDTLLSEFKNIAKTVTGKAQKTGNLPINFNKNRFAQVVPYDENRVVLCDGYTADKSTDFVNASYISGYEQDKKYIAAQGPRDNTADDFWRMVWQEKITHIVMLTNILEGTKNKCYQYWGEKEGSVHTFGPVTVTNRRIEARDSLYIRTFTIKHQRNTGSREVTQFHFTKWPDHEVPETTSLVTVWRYVTSRTANSTAPLLVHCSAGVGRTGTYIGLDKGFAQAIKEGAINVLDLVNSLREERPLMVQAPDQYVFLHEALLEAYTARDTLLSVDNCDVIFPQSITAFSANDRIDKEFQKLMQLQPALLQLPQEMGRSQENTAKNRHQDVLPLDSRLVYLSDHVAGRNQYINAVFVPTFRESKGTILTQLPLPATLVDFWRMVYGNNIASIVSLASPCEEQVQPFCQYWPLEASTPVKAGPFEISLDSMTTVSDIVTSYNLIVRKTTSTTSETLSAQLFHYKGYEGEVDAKNTSSLLQIAELATDMSRIVIQCSDGVSKSGLFSVLCDVINRIKHDGEIDVYMAVRRVQVCCPRAVTSLTQYRFCYQAAQQKSRDINVYANT